MCRPQKFPEAAGLAPPRQRTLQGAFACLLVCLPLRAWGTSVLFTVVSLAPGPGSAINKHLRRKSESL